MDETNDILIIETDDTIAEYRFASSEETGLSPLRKLAMVAMGLDTGWRIHFKDGLFLELADVIGEKKITLYKSCNEVYVRDRGVERVLVYKDALNGEKFKAFVEHVREGAIYNMKNTGRIEHQQ